MHQHWLRLILSMSLVLSACSTFHPHQPTISEPSQPTSARTLQHWEVSGMLAARHQHQGWTASFAWYQEDPEHERIHLFGPMGTHAIILERDHDKVTYHDANQVESAQDAETLLYEKTKQHIPFNNLHAWIRGLPGEGASETRYDASHHLIELKQNNHTVTWSHYILVEGVPLPTKITIRHEHDLVKLVIRKWTLKRAESNT